MTPQQFRTNAPPRWDIRLHINGRATLLGTVSARDEDGAKATAAREFSVARSERRFLHAVRCAR
jgi:hypothetical protein